MIALIAASALILADLFMKRRNSLFITRLLCILVPASQLIVLAIAFYHFSSLSYAEQGHGSLYWNLSAWALAAIYFSLRLMLASYDFLSVPEKPSTLSAFGLRYNICTLLTYFIGFVAMIVAVFLFSDVILRALGGIVGLLAAYGLLLFLAFIALLSLVLAPLGLVILALIAIDILGSSIAMVIVGVVLIFLLAVPIVLGIRAVRSAVAQGKLSAKSKVILIVFMSLPLANTVTLLVFSRMLKKG